MKKLIAQEIAIGSYVWTRRADQSPFRVDSIYPVMGGEYQVAQYPDDFDFGTPMHPYTWDLNECAGYPLTTEILVTWFGFKQLALSPEFHIKRWGSNGAVFVKSRPEYGPGAWSFDTGGSTNKIFHFVHELQNLYLAHTEQTLIKNR